MRKATPSKPKATKVYSQWITKVQDPLEVMLTLDFFKLEQLCLMKPVDAIKAIANGHLEGIIPLEEAPKWKLRCDRRSQDSTESKQYILLLQSFVNFVI